MLIFMLLLISFIGYSQETYKDILATKYVPIDSEIYAIIAAKDKAYFDAYNACDMKTQKSFYSEDLEFFHDKGGLSTSKKRSAKLN